MFADLRGQTDFVETRGDHAGATLIERYRRIVREVVAAEQGREIRTEGDSFYIVFDSASGAVQAGLAIQAAATADPEEPVRLGVGIHAGEAVSTSEGYVGAAVNLAARVCTQAGAGEVVVSDTVRGLTRTYLDVDFLPIGSRRPKGVTEPVPLYRVAARGAAPAVHPVVVPRRRLAPVLGRLGTVGLAVTGIVLSVLALALIVGRPGSARPSDGAATLAAAVTSPWASVGAIPTVSPGPASSGLVGANPTAPTEAFPNAAETSLLRSLKAVRGDLAAHCDRGPYDGLDDKFANFGVAPHARVPTVSLSCRLVAGTGIAQVVIRQFAPSTVKDGFVTLYLANIVDNHTKIALTYDPKTNNPVTKVLSMAIPPGDYATSASANGRWSLRGEDHGAIICSTDPESQDALLDWSCDPEAILVTARSARGDRTGLYQLFEQISPFIASP